MRGPITENIGKLGGQPIWLDTPTWPIGASTGEPMMFIGQIPVPGEARMAYLFMTDDDDGMAAGYTADAGDTALLIQPGGRVPAFMRTTREPIGPSLWRRGATWTEKIPVELHIDLAPLDVAEEARLETAIDAQESERAGIFLDVPEDLPCIVSYVGGRPHFWQPTCIDVDDNWRFFFQLDGGDEGCDSTSYTLNFGGGTGYAFLSPDHLEGRFYWDCV